MTFPTVAVDTTDIDSDADSPLTARQDLLDAIQKLNQIIAHVSTFAATILDDADAGAVRTTISAQTLDSELTAIAGLASDADKGIYFTGPGAASLFTLTSLARNLLDDAAAGDMRTTLGLVIGTNVQAQDAELQAIAGLTSAADQVILFTGSGTASLFTITSAARTVLDDTSVGAMLTTLGGQPLDAELTAIAGLTSAADRGIYFTGSGAASLFTFTALARNLLDDATAGDMQTTLGISAFVKTILDDAAATDVMSTLGFSTFFKTLVDDAAATNVLTTLGVSAFVQTIFDDADAGAVRSTIGAQASDATLTALAAFNTNGFLVQTAADTFAGRTMQSGTGISISNPAGAAGDPSIGHTAAYTLGKVSLPFPAEALSPRSANGCATLATSNGASNQPDVPYLAFDGAAKEYARFYFRMPKSWNEGTITASFCWRRASGTGAANVVWGIRGAAVSDNETPAITFGSDATVTDAASTTTANFNNSGETGACTIAGSPAAEDLVFFEVFRDGASGSDTLDAVDAWLTAISLHITVDAIHDA